MNSLCNTCKNKLNKTVSKGLKEVFTVLFKTLRSSFKCFWASSTSNSVQVRFLIVVMVLSVYCVSLFSCNLPRTCTVLVYDGKLISPSREGKKSSILGVLLLFCAAWFFRLWNVQFWELLNVFPVYLTSLSWHSLAWENCCKKRIDKCGLRIRLMH